MTRRDDLELSHKIDCESLRENAVKQDRVQTSNAIRIILKGPDFCVGRNL